MSRSSLVPRIFLGLTALCVLATGAFAAEDDFEFAQALAARGYVDLAEETYSNLLNDPRAPAARKAEGQLGLALLKFGQARIVAADTRDRTRKPFAEVLKMFESADSEIAAFIDRNARHARVLDAKLQRAKVLQERAQYVKKAIESGWVPSDVSQDDLKKQMADGFATAIKMLQAVEKKARADVLSAEDSDARDAAEFELGKVWLNRLIAMLGKGAALPKGNSAGEAALTGALNEISEEFMWDFEGRIFGIWANYYAGLICKELDDPKEAIDYLQTAAHYAIEAPDTVAPIINVTFTSFVGLADTALFFESRDGNFPRMALESLAKMQADWPGRLKYPGGQRAELAHARLLQHDGQTEKAVGIVQEVIAAAAATGSNVDQEAGIVLSELLSVGNSNGGSTTVNPKLLVNVARSKWNAADFGGCIQANQGVLRACTTPELMDEFGWSAWSMIGNCYGAQKRYYAAFLALDEIWAAWLRNRSNATLDDLTNESGYLRAQTLDLVYRQSRDPADKVAATKALEDFAKLRPASPRNMDAGSRAAYAKLREAKAILKTDVEAGKALVREAMALLKKIDPSSPTIDKVEASIAECHLLLEDHAKALELAEAWLAKKRPRVIEAAPKAARIEGARIAITVKLRSLTDGAYKLAPGSAERKAAYERVLTALDLHEADFVEATTGGKVVALQWRAEALIEAGKVDEAETLVWKFIKAEPDHPNARYLAGTMAIAVADVAEVWLGKGDVERFKQTMLRAAKLREFVLDHMKEREPKVVVFVAESFSKGGDFAKAEKYLAEALEIYRELVENETDKAKKEALQNSLESVRIQQISLLLDQVKFAEAIPLLEERLAADPTQRGEIVTQLQGKTGITRGELPVLLSKMSRNRGVLRQLSRAWLLAKTKERLVGCINLCDIMLYATPKDDRHNTPEYVTVKVRQLEAYYQYGVDYQQPAAFNNVISGIQNGILTPGYEEAYETLLPGTARKLQSLLNDAKTKKGM